MKKCISIILALLCTLSLLINPVNAAEVSGFSAHLHNNVGGCDYNDMDKLLTLNTEHLKFSDTRSSPVQINDYVGNVYLDKMKPGRTYYISYSFVVDDGYTVPELTDENIDIICDKGCEALWCLKAYGVNARNEKCDCVSLYEKVTVPGNFFQRIFGRLADIFAKMAAWSPY